MNASDFNRLWGFMLIELVVVMAVIAALISIAIPQYASYTEKAREAACISEREAANKVIAIYTQDNPGTELESLEQLVTDGYLKTRPNCPFGGEYLLIPTDDENPYPRIGCSLHFWPTLSEPSPGVLTTSTTTVVTTTSTTTTTIDPAQKQKKEKKPKKEKQKK